MLRRMMNHQVKEDVSSGSKLSNKLYVKVISTHLFIDELPPHCAILMQKISIFLIIELSLTFSD